MGAAAYCLQLKLGVVAANWEEGLLSKTSDSNGSLSGLGPSYQEGNGPSPSLVICFHKQALLTLMGLEEYWQQGKQH